MTTADSSLPPSTDPLSATGVAPLASTSERWAQLEALLDSWGDRLNPILVKEARQAMKSRQFIVTFSLLLIFGWLWTILFVTFGVPYIFYNPSGPVLLGGYYLLLTIPLLIVVPYAAFRSLAAEQEDGTYELLSITTLSATQIVYGKLASAVLQMLVYYSALAPCIAFTYLLRGIDVLSIAMYLGYTFLASLKLCVIGLMLATVTRSRMWQVLLSVLFVMTLLVFTFFWNMAFLSIMGEGAMSRAFDESAFWIAMVAMLSFYSSFIVLILFIAASLITFASENRSTRIRWVLLVQQLLWISWTIYYWIADGDDEVLFVFGGLGALYWALVGAILSSETAELSARAKRELPRSFAGRLLFTWANPGSGTGYIFSTALFANVVVTMLLFGTVHSAATLQSVKGEWQMFLLAMLFYLVAYLGITRLIVVLLRRFIAVNMFASVLLHVVVPLLGVLVPLVLQALLTSLLNAPYEYTPLQASNWIWTLATVADFNSASAEVSLMIMALVAIMVFLGNLISAAKEVQLVRLETPNRVLQDDQKNRPAPVVRKGPWDEPAPAQE